jgi:purine nucleoside phosphorylase
VLGSGLGDFADAVLDPIVVGYDALPGFPRPTVAGHCGLRVVAISVITNLAEGMGDEVLSHQQTLAGAAQGADDLHRLLLSFIARLNG